MAKSLRRNSSRNKLIVMFVVLSNAYCQAQNLIPNPSFEDTVSCPSSIGQLNRAKFWTNPTTTTPDYFNACNAGIYIANVPYTPFGYQTAKTGVALAGFYAFNKGAPNLREYVQTNLSTPLVLNHKYLVSFYVNLSDGSQYSLSSIGAYFSSSAISSTNSVVLSYSPQIANKSNIQLADTVSWMLIEDTLISDGTEQYITIGNFNTDTQSDTTYLGWWSSNNISYYYIDDVSVIDVASLGVKSNPELSYRTYPNPATNILNIECASQRVDLRISDVLGNEIHREMFSRTTHIDASDLSPGIYFISLHTNGQILTEKFVKE